MKCHGCRKGLEVFLDVKGVLHHRDGNYGDNWEEIECHNAKFIRTKLSNPKLHHYCYNKKTKRADIPVMHYELDEEWKRWFKLQYDWFSEIEYLVNDLIGDINGNFTYEHYNELLKLDDINLEMELLVIAEEEGWGITELIRPDLAIFTDFK